MFSVFDNLYDIAEYIAETAERDAAQIRKIINAITAPFAPCGEAIKTWICETYIESEWNDLYRSYYAVHYRGIPATVQRIHFVSESIDAVDKITETNYRGYITLRPLRSPISIVSRVRLRYSACYYEADAVGILPHRRSVHFPHRTITYPSFPFFRQDGTVTVCAHADIHMLVKAMSPMRMFNYFGITTLLRSVRDTGDVDIPSEGLTIDSIQTALKHFGYRPMVTEFRNGKFLDTDSRELFGFERFVDSMLQSALPLIVAYEQHVILIGGVSYDADAQIDGYVVFDDSGAHLRSLLPSRHHTGVVKKSILRQRLETIRDLYVIVPTYQSLFLRFRTIVKRLHEDSMFSSFVLAGDYRLLIVEGILLKQHLHRHGITAYDDVLLPRYVWLLELYEEGSLRAFAVMDAGINEYAVSLPFVPYDSQGHYLYVADPGALVPIELLQTIKKGES